MNVEELAADFDHQDPASAPGIHEFLAELRQSCPVAHSTRYGGFWLVTKYDHIAEVAKDHDRFSSAVQGLGAVTLLPALATTKAILFEHDPPEHSGWRRLMQRFFTPPAVAGYEPYIRDVTRQVLDELRPKGAGDLVPDLAVPIPLLVTGALLGMTEDERLELRTLARAFFTSGGLPPEQAGRAQERYAGFLLDQVRSRRGRESHDVLTVVVNGKVDGRAATEDELVKFVFLMVAAGHLTTTDTVASTLLLLAEDLTLRKRVIDDPALIPALVEESVRYESAVAATGRTVREKTTLAGTELSPGERLLLTWGSGNRDAERFAEADEFRIDRPRSPQLGWGVGAHRCLGVHLARLELRVIVQEVLRAIPDFRLASGARPQRTYGVLRGLDSLPVTWTV